MSTSAPAPKAIVDIGVPWCGVKKTHFVQCLGEFLRVFSLPRRPNDFSGGNRDFDLWVIDEFGGYETSLDLLNMVLDGQRVQSDSKYGRVFEKTKNVPIILLGNKVFA